MAKITLKLLKSLGLTLYLYRKGEKFAIRVDDYVTGGGSDSTVYLYQ